MSIARLLVPTALLLAAGTAVFAVYRGDLAVPSRWNPWAPLDVTEAPGPFTRWKLSRMAEAPPAVCYAWLDGAGVRHAPVYDRAETDDCGWQGATRLISVGSVRLSTPTPLTCPVVAALAIWERHALQPSAYVHLGSRVTQIDHLGSYACRNIYGGSADRRSEHARANALDIAGFRLANGRRISVRQDWSDATVVPQPLPGQFLREAEKGACPLFSAVLSPAYNDAHRDHFHFDRGPFRVCS
ncbi:extensin family protein [Xylophilus sp. GOD-11R]|uniref:extensin-like domain-containing protein n=1 Tax=Xylophilus sp. GOD-11R TaxID=3089814 RepID=UPI00298C11F4|nr:extensin family protein [Xylophilus sp. GOD-11R]WPB57837.1 extensin family protein [Xylophilus sp. GOD-11R]